MKRPAEMTDQELVAKSFDLAAMRKKFEDAPNDPRYEDRFKNQPERQINPEFLKLENEINTELTNRNLKK